MIKKLGIGCGGLILLLVVLSVVGGGTRTSPSEASPATQTQAPPVTAPAAAATTAATAAPATPAPTPRPTPSPVVLRGSGQTATDPINLPGPISLAAFTHTGARNFAVHSFIGTNRELLINTIGSYEGTRPLRGTEPVRLQIEADGAWTVTVSAITCCATSGTFAGRGDAVSNQFNAAGSSTWDMTHDGQRNFAVHLQCGTNRQLIQNRIGTFQGSTILVIPSGPCHWEVQADGNWSLKPR